MDVFVLNENFETVAVIDTYVSLIWTERYSECGDFELYTLVDPTLLHYIRKDYYLSIKESNATMIIEDILLDTDVESGLYITVTGRSLESILDRRIIWGQKDIKGNLQDAIQLLLNDSIISPSDPDRQINNFIFEKTTNEYIAQLNIDVQFTGDNLYDVIATLCNEAKVGFRIILNESNQFVFSLYYGKDRSYDQDENSYVVFSPEFDNIINSSYVESNKTLKNVTLVAGEGEGASRRMTSVGSGTGLNRREMFTDAGDISSNVDSGNLLSNEYVAKLEQRGIDELSKNAAVSSFEGKVDSTRMFLYGVHFFIGDIVQVANEYGIEGTARITELIRSHSDAGLDVYPTFKMIE